MTSSLKRKSSDRIQQAISFDGGTKATGQRGRSVSLKNLQQEKTKQKTPTSSAASKENTARFYQVVPGTPQQEGGERMNPPRS